MAILWQKKTADRHYEVRTAGHSRRLYKNGVCHSQFNPRNPVTGSIWDLLILPAFYQPEVSIRRVLVLGVGGGAVIRQLAHLAEPQSITGIEKDPLHLEIARRFFELDLEGVELVESDAVAWLGAGGRKKYDLIIEDLFDESGGKPVRAVSADHGWIETLEKHLSRDGILVMNFASQAEFRRSALHADMNLRNRFESIYRLTLPTLDNYVVAMHRTAVDQRHIHAAIKRHPELERAILSRKLKYRIGKVRQLKVR